MIFACDHCGRRYSVPDERVKGRPFRVTCRACAQVIVVRPGAPGRAEPPERARVVPAPQAAPTVPPPSPAVAPPQTWPAAAEPAGAAEPPPPPPAAEEPPPEAAPAPAPPGPVPEARPTVPMSAAEAAWLAGDAPTAAPDLAAEHRELVAAGLAAPGGRPVRPRRAVFAAAAGVVAIAGAALLWGTLHGRAPPPREAARAAVVPAQPPAPSPAAPTPAAAEPAPERTAEPVPAPAGEPGLTPPPAASPAPPADARFEAGTVTVARARRRHAHALDQKDRKLLDLLARKDVGTDPPEQVERLDLDTGRSLSPAAVERVVGEGQGAFSSCLTRALKSRQPGAAAHRATLLLTVDPGGAVATAWVAEAEVDRSALGACLTAAARRLVFPSFEGDPVDVSVPLVLGGTR